MLAGRAAGTLRPRALRTASRSTSATNTQVPQHARGKDDMHLRELVRKLDYDNYVCGLLLPQSVRPAYFAIVSVLGSLVAVMSTMITNNSGDGASLC